MAANLVAVVFTVVFTRILGTGGYGSLAALLNLTVILFVPGSALQVAAAREATLGRLGRGGELAGTLDALEPPHPRRARRRSPSSRSLAREPLADLINVEQAWAAAAVPMTARAVAAAVRAARAAAVGARLPRGRAERARSRRSGGSRWRSRSSSVGLDVTGAYLGTLASIAVTAAALAWLLRRRLGRARPRHPPAPAAALARGAALPIAALTLVAALQNVDVIMAKHVLDDDGRRRLRRLDGRRQGGGLDRRRARHVGAAGGDPPRRRRPRPARGAAARAGGDRGPLGGALAIFAAVPELLLRTAFGADYESGADVLLQARRRLRAARRDVPVRAVPARPAPARVRAGPGGDGGGRAAAAARRRRPRGVRPHRAARAGRHRRRCCSP